MNNGAITTLIVKHLPDFITTSPELREKYFKPYNPIDIRFMQSQSMIGFVFLDFLNRSLAEKAFELLKKINFGLYYKQITVEYAKPDPNRQNNFMLHQSMTIEQQEQAAEPVSVPHSLMFPPNPHLKYYYPDPTPDILTNITHAIATVPRFYTQVLHLMNKYNMPPPFGPADKDAKSSLLKRKHDQLLASDESELEDDDNDDAQKQQKEKDQGTTEEKVKQARLFRIAAEKQKLALQKQSSASTTSTATTTPHAPNKMIKINIGPLRLTAEQQALRQQCKPISELTDLAAFKNYEEGAPSPKLYIKNLDKQTTLQELTDLYSTFSQDVHVDLMTKGRLRGQAFVSFKEKSQASLALQCTHGYVLHDRPMSVQYGKESTASSSSISSHPPPKQ